MVLRVPGGAWGHDLARMRHDACELVNDVCWMCSEKEFEYQEVGALAGQLGCHAPPTADHDVHGTVHSC